MTTREQKTEAMRRFRLRHGPRLNAAKVSRYHSDPAFRERVKQRAKANADANPERVKATQWRNHLRRAYGLSLDDYDQMLVESCGLCAICDNQMKPPHVDHCHTTGRVRGMLCEKCNLKLGVFESFRDNDRAQEYLK